MVDDDGNGGIEEDRGEDDVSAGLDTLALPRTSQGLRGAERPAGR